MASQQDVRGEAGFGSDHTGGALGATRRSSAGGRGRRRLPGGRASSEWAMSLNVAGGPLETSGAFVERTVDMNVSKFPALEAGFMVTGVVTRQGGVVVTAGPPDVGAFQGDLFFFSQGG